VDGWKGGCVVLSDIFLEQIQRGPRKLVKKNIRGAQINRTTYRLESSEIGAEAVPAFHGHPPG
jgi:hypothetical protein